MDAWARVASSIEKTVDVRSVRLPPGGRGWHVVVRVDAAVRLADGRDVRTLHGPRVSVEPSALARALEGKADARGSSTSAGGPDNVDSGPTETPAVGGKLQRGQQRPDAAGAVIQGIAQRVLPTPTLSVSGKVCSASLSLSPTGVGVSGACSVENAGNPARRIVSGHIVSEGNL
jgi:hypothetical protein